MVHSMTGFGKAMSDINGDIIVVELCSVNHRFFDCSLRLPNGWNALEPAIKQAMKKHVARGKVNGTITRRRTRTHKRTIQFDQAVAQQYLDASESLRAMLGAEEKLSLNVLAQLEGVFCEEDEEEDIAEVEGTLIRTVLAAVEHLNKMRSSEGTELAKDVRQRVDLLRDALALIEERLPELNGLYETRLRERIAEMAADSGITEERIAIEVAMLADKGDVTEEIVRLKTHFNHVEEVLAANEPIGRRLDFLAQEIQREINTLGVKTRDADVARHVLEMKSQLERIREQVQNIE